MSQADLEISLFHRSANDYGVTLRFRHPAAGQDKSTSGLLALDEAALLQRQHDPTAYGELLAVQLFAGEGVRSFLDQALAVAASQQTPLHLRLFIHPDAAALHSLRWETLRLPGRATPLAVGDRVRFSRYLDSAGWRPAHTVERDALRALVAVASPDVRGTTLAEVRTEDELAAARAGLGDIPSIELAGRGQVTSNNLLARLRDGCDILYLVAHGALVEGEPQILLEAADGGRAWTSGRELAARLGELAQPPSLVVLASCQSAGTGGADRESPDGGALAGLGPRLAAAGVPAVVAMQGNVSMATTAAFMPVFLRELRRDGQVDRAMAVARGAVRERSDWWMPVLYSRLEDGRVFDLAAMLPPPTCPYPGMVPFRAGDARFFYGREDEVQQMMDHLRHQRLLLVIGPSGSGKSSLIAAGLLPRLEKSTYFAPDFWLVRTMRPLDHPATALAACLEGDVSQPEQAVAALLAAHAPAQRLLLVIDQFEEVFSLADKAERQQFMAALQVLRRSQPCALVIALRADFYPDLMNCELWPVDPGQRLDVAVLRGGALRQAIRQPAADVEVEINEALIERLLADAAGEPGALPMLQETLVLLWERMRRRQITLGDYEQLGEGERSGLAVAVARKADATVAELTPAEQLIAQRIFLRLIQFGEGRRDTRRQLPAADLRSAAEDDQAFERTLEHLARNRLLTTSGEEGGGRRVDIAHEALITGWPRLHGWLRERKDAEVTRRRLEEKAKEWVRLGRGEGGLLDKTELTEAEAWFASSEAKTVGISDHLRQLVEYSRKTINPGWHKSGTFAIIVGSVAIVSLAALLPLVTIGLPWHLRLALFGTAAVLMGVLLWLTGFLRLNDPYRIQRLSQTLARRRLIRIPFFALALFSIFVWTRFGVHAAAITNYCTSQGYSDDFGEVVSVAMHSDDLDPYYLKLARDEVNKHPDVAAWMMPSTDVSRCARFFRYFVELERDNPPGGNEIGFAAQVREGPRGVSSRERVIRAQVQCDMFAEIGQKILVHLPVTPLQALAEQEFRPQITSCQAFMRNEEGFAELQQGNLEVAAAFLQEAVTLEPSFAVAHNNFGLVFLRQANYHQARTEFLQATKLQPSNGIFLLNLGIACYRLDDFPCGEESYERALSAESLRPTAPHVILEAYNNLGVLFREQGKLVEAENAFSRAASYLPSLPNEDDRRWYRMILEKNTGILRYRERRWQDAIETLGNARILDTDELWAEEITYYLALSYEGDEDNRRACGVWLEYDMTPSSGLFREAERRKDSVTHTTMLGCSPNAP